MVKAFVIVSPGAFQLPVFIFVLLVLNSPHILGILCSLYSPLSSLLHVPCVSTWDFDQDDSSSQWSLFLHPGPESASSLSILLYTSWNNSLTYSSQFLNSANPIETHIHLLNQNVPSPLFSKSLHLRNIMPDSWPFSTWSLSFFFLNYFIYLFWEREEGRKKERERNINV